VHRVGAETVCQVNHWNFRLPQSFLETTARAARSRIVRIRDHNNARLAGGNWSGLTISVAVKSHKARKKKFYFVPFVPFCGHVLVDLFKGAHSIFRTERFC
jgi:hypothetical protein